jgi:hypothetical protein
VELVRPALQAMRHRWLKLATRLSKSTQESNERLVDCVRDSDPGRVFCNYQGTKLGEGVLWASVHDDELKVFATLET